MYIIPDIKECASNACMNGATCNEDINKYTCTCVPGYNGVNCEEGGYLSPISVNPISQIMNVAGYLFLYICQLILVMLTFVSYSRNCMIRMLSMSRNECKKSRSLF